MVTEFINKCPNVECSEGTSVYMYPEGHLGPCAIGPSATQKGQPQTVASISWIRAKYRFLY